MAEIIGTVASGIAIAQLAASIANSIVAIKEGWSQVQDAPAEVDNLMRQIDSLNLILQHIEHDQSQEDLPQLSSANLCVRQSLALCEEGAAELAALADELTAKIHGKQGWRKKLGSANIVLRKADIKKLKSRMKNAIQLLSLSYQLHTNAMARLQPEIIVARLSTHLASITTIETTYSSQGQPESNDGDSRDLISRQYDSWTSSYSWMRFLIGEFEFRSCVKTHKGRERQEFYAKYKFPGLLSTSQVECRGFRSLSGWCLHPKIYREMTSDFLNAVWDGDTSKAQQILLEKKAMVTDRRKWDSGTALHVAAENGNIEMCRLLLSHGADPLALDSYDQTPLHELMRSGGHLSFMAGLDLFELYQLLLNAGADEILIDNIEVFESYRGPVNNLKYLQRQAYPPYHGTPLHVRLAGAADSLSASSSHNAPVIFETLLDNDGQINAEIAEWTNEEGQTLLYLLWASYARKLSSRVEDLHLDNGLDLQDLETMEGISNDYFSLCRRLSCKLVSAGASVQSVNNEGHTLLTRMIYGFCKTASWETKDTTDGFKIACRKPKEMFKIVNKLTKDWLFALLESGVDLHEYGAWESRSLQKKNFRLYSRIYESHEDRGDNEEDEEDENTVPNRQVRWYTIFHIRLINIEYGPDPKDWIFWLSEPSDPFAGDFWAMIEGKEHWRRIEKGWFLDAGVYGLGRGWYFDEKAAGSDEKVASVDALHMPGSWEF
ncbi:ankyrin [Hyaloscypha variabilis]